LKGEAGLGCRIFGLLHNHNSLTAQPPLALMKALERLVISG
jgi:hypothetical protein